MCFFFNDTATTEIYTLSLHDALPIFSAAAIPFDLVEIEGYSRTSTAIIDPMSGTQMEINEYGPEVNPAEVDRKSTRLNSSHANISYAVFCLKKKQVTNNPSVYTVTST